MRRLPVLLLIAAISCAVAAGRVRPRVPAYAKARLVFRDEFHGRRAGTAVDTAKWAACPRGTSTWNRFVSDSPAVAFVSNGQLVLRCIPGGAAGAMLSGAVETRDRFSFTHGLVEVRMKTTNHRGNFPAAWLMPQPPCAPWPDGGEIDIFESIDGENRSYHTAHSRWIDVLHRHGEPPYSGSRATDVAQWHVYGLEWTPARLTWYIDGEQVFSYPKSPDPEALGAGQWPFEHPFYIILNQSVGDGSWAAEADTAFTYESRVDWVRVWQPRGGKAR